MMIDRSDKGQRVRALIRQNRWPLIAGAGVVVFTAILTNLFSSQIARLDSAAYWIFVEKLRSDWMTPIMEGFSALASPVGLLAMLIMVGAFAPGRRPGWAAATNLVLVVILNTLLKNIVQRPRPEGFRLISEVGYSFPSGHSMVAVAFYGFLAWLIWKYMRDPLVRWFYTIVFGLLILAIGASRIYLGVHYASDVIAGFLVAFAWLVFFTKVLAPLFLPDVHDLSLDNPEEKPLLEGTLFEHEEPGL